MFYKIFGVIKKAFFLKYPQLLIGKIMWLMINERDFAINKQKWNLKRKH